MPATSTVSIVANKGCGVDPFGQNLPNRGRIRKFINNLVGIVGGASGYLELRGFNSTLGLIIVGACAVLFGIYQLVSDAKKKKAAAAATTSTAMSAGTKPE